MRRCEGKTAIVTGGARGIGAAVTKVLVSEGAKVCFSYSASEGPAAQLAAELREAGGEVMALRADARDASQLQAMVEAVVSAWGRIDILVNNAGIVRDNLALTMSDEDWDEVLRVNLGGPFRTVRAVARQMLLQRAGCIVNLSSVAASRPNRGQVNYAASKGGVESMTRALAVELGKKNIRVNAVAPGVIETEMSARVRELAGAEIRQQILLRRFGTADEVAQAVLFLVSDAAAYITGEVLHVDGGLRL